MWKIIFIHKINYFANLFRKQTFLLATQVPKSITLDIHSISLNMQHSYKKYLSTIEKLRMSSLVPNASSYHCLLACSHKSWDLSSDCKLYEWMISIKNGILSKEYYVSSSLSESKQSCICVLKKKNAWEIKVSTSLIIS